MIRHDEYLRTVAEAIDYIVKLKNRQIQDVLYKYKIARLATEVCDIRHGGYSKGLYTLKEFSNDIGFNDKSLNSWVQTYRCVIEKGEIEIKDETDWNAAMTVCNILKKERALANKVAGKTGTLSAFKKNVPKNKILYYYDSIKDNEKPFEREIVSTIQAAKHIKYLMKTRDLKIVRTEQLTELMELLDCSSDLINDFLTKEKKGR